MLECIPLFFFYFLKASLEPAPGQAARDCWAVAFGNSFSDEERSLCAGCVMTPLSDVVLGDFTDFFF